MELLALNSGGIDSPAAIHMLLRNGHRVEAVTFDLAPFTSEEDVATARETVERLEDVHGVEIPMRVVPHGFVQERFLDVVGEEAVAYNCLFSRRVMLRTAERIAETRGMDGLVTGESLGQVASQTLANVVVTGSAVDIPVVRPLIGMDKNDIIAEAKDAGTYQISTQGGVQCAAHIDYPETRGVVEEMERIEEQFDVGGMVEEALADAD